MANKNKELGLFKPKTVPGKAGSGKLFEEEFLPSPPKIGPVECLGMTFESDEARREHFLGLLREGLEELHAKLGGVPFTTVEDAVERMKSLEKWPMPACRDEHGAGRGDDARLRELAERMRHADSSKDLLQRWKAEVGFPACAAERSGAAGRPHLSACGHAQAGGEIEDILNLSDPPYYTACPNPFIADFIKHYGKPYDPNVPYSKEPFAADVSAGKGDRSYYIHTYHTKVPPSAISEYVSHYTEQGNAILVSCHT